MKRFFVLVATLTSLWIQGCATVNPMAIDKESAKVDVTQTSLMLMTVRIARPEESRYVPIPLVAKFEEPGATEKAQRQNYKIDSEAGDSQSSVSVDTYKLRMAIKPGRYQLLEIFGKTSAFPFNGFFMLPLFQEVTIPPNAVVYLGRINALMRPRVDDEFRAGSVIPLIDQAAAGVSGCTFDVSVVDASAEDLPVFRASFPALASVQIVPDVLPPFDRAVVQKRWEGESNDANAASTPTPAAK